MFRNQYDSDVTVWSPQGRLHQVEYAMEAVKLGSATVGLKNSTHATLVALKRASSELSAHQKKIIPLSPHAGVCLSGLTADARVLSRFLRSECMNYNYLFGVSIPITRLMNLLANKMQQSTQRYDRRPYGVGLLVAGYDQQGPHIYQSCPSANILDCRAMAIGSRSQSARTYLEKHLNVLNQGDVTSLIKHGLRALRDTLPNETELTSKNVAIGVVGVDTPWREFTEEETKVYLGYIAGEERRGPAADAQPAPVSIAADSSQQQPSIGPGGEQPPEGRAPMDTQ